ncbi:MAG: hypothetical protein J5897_05595, partial [Candidatus Methanomethylophilus sp.]|nr:hypothetical protein [Methanomethylophilus sp.]
IKSEGYVLFDCVYKEKRLIVKYDIQKRTLSYGGHTIQYDTLSDSEKNLLNQEIKILHEG